MNLGILQEDDDLLAGHSGETFKKVFDRLSGFKVVEQPFDWHPRPRENRFSAQNLRVNQDDLVHVRTLAPQSLGINPEPAQGPLPFLPQGIC